MVDDDLAKVLEDVHIFSNGRPDDWIDNILEEQQPREHLEQSLEDIKHGLEHKYLTPKTSFSKELLRELQL